MTPTSPTSTADHQYTDQQRAAIFHPQRPLLIVAGAGSGKTTVMASRIVATASEVDQRNILGLTFSNKAAAHLRTAVVKTLGADSDVVVSTYHGFGASIVERWGTRLGLPGRTRLLDHAQSLQLLYDVFQSMVFEHRRTGAPLGILQDALQLSSRLCDHLVPLATVEADCRRLIDAETTLPYVLDATRKRMELLPVIAEYRRRKVHLGLLDHDDQIALAHQLSSDYSDIRAHLGSLHRAVLLDEYQDTNFAQRRLLQVLFGATGAPPITAVGDDMQSIYAFRGAHLENLKGFVSHFDTERPDAVALVLGTSFRNDRAVLELANRIQSQVQNAEPKTLVPRPGAGPGWLGSSLAADSWSEAKRIANHIGQLIDQGTPYREISVLCRKKKLIGPIVEALEAAAIPAEVIGIGGLLSRPEVIELRCWLEVLANHDERRTAVPLLRLLRGPRYRIGLHDLAALTSRPPSETNSTDPSSGERAPGGIEAGLADFHRRPISAEAADRVTRFNAERAALQADAAQLPLIELIDHIVTYTGLWQAVEGTLPTENLARFMHVADQFRPLVGARSLDEFLNWLNVMEEAETDLSEAVQSGTDAVQVMTIHQAKGLEFDHVVIPGLAAGPKSQLFPDTSRTDFPPTQSVGLPHWLRTDHDGQTDAPTTKGALNALRDRSKRVQLDEEWRLLYVAVTRARHGVLFSAAHWYGDTNEPQGPSSFFTWIREQDDLVTRIADDESPSDEAPGTAERRRREAQAAVRRADDEASASKAGTIHGASTGAARSNAGRKVPTAQLGFSFAAAAPVSTGPRVPQALPVSAFSMLARCARQFHWTYVRPMPQSGSAASVTGTRVHSWIEAHGARLQLAERQPSLFDNSDVQGSFAGPPLQQDRVSPAGHNAKPGSGSTGFTASFLASSYASLAPLHVELPITLDADGLLVRGRIDAVYRDPQSGHIDVVDFKTGRLPLPSDPGAPTQLDLYGLAVRQRLQVDSGSLSTSGLYLRADGGTPIEIAHPWTSERASAANLFLVRSAARVRSGDQQPTTGLWCNRCPYADLCTEGRAAIEQQLNQRVEASSEDSSEDSSEGSIDELFLDDDTLIVDPDIEDPR